MVKYVELEKDTLDFWSGPWEAPELPVFAPDYPYVAKEIVSMPDSYYVQGQVWDDATNSLVDTPVSLSKKAQGYLQKTDWYVIRFIETNKAIPEDITAARAAAREQVIS